MKATVFNPIQQHLLMMFAYDSNEEHLKEILQFKLRKHNSLVCCSIFHTFA